MVRRRCSLAALAVVSVLGLGPRSGLAASITLTGNVERDFPVQPGVKIIVDNPRLTPAPAPGTLPESLPTDVTISKAMRDAGRQTGMNFKDLRMHYDEASDTLYVGVRFFGIAGDVDGDGDPSRTAPSTASVGGVDQPGLGGRETIAIGLDLNNDRRTDIIAGIPVDKRLAGPGLNGFKVAAYRETGMGLLSGFGETLLDHQGILAFNPDKDHPDFEFTIKNFSKYPGFDVHDGFGITAYAGSADAGGIIGEDIIPYTAVAAQTIIPEPTTILAWGLALGAGAIFTGRHRRPSRTSP